jgi:hypothetical protein
MTIKGRAHDETEVFEFTIEPFVAGGYRLDIRYSGDYCKNVTGAGVWPTVEKAQQIAEETAHRLLRDATVVWDSPAVHNDVPGKPDYSGMTVNERLFAAGLTHEFDTAARQRNRAKLVELLLAVQVERNDAEQSANRILAAPGFYGY